MLVTTDIMINIFVQLAAGIASHNYDVVRAHLSVEASDDISWAFLDWCPVGIAQVCRRWRTICFENKSIWSYITIPFIAELHPSHRYRMFNRIRRILDICGENQSLHVYIYAIDGHSFNCSTSTVFRATRDLIWSKSAQWGSLTVLQSLRDETVEIWELPARPTNALHSLRFMESTIRCWPSLPSSFLRGPHASNIHLGYLSHLYLDIRAEYTDFIPLSALDSLRHVDLNLHHSYRPTDAGELAVSHLVSDNTLDYAMDLVSGSISLRTLTITVPSRKKDISKWQGRREDKSYTREEIHLPALESLILKGYEIRGASFINVIRFVIAKDMKILCLSEPCIPDLAAVMRGWGSALTTLTLTIRPIPEEYAIPADVVNAAPNLIYLTVNAIESYRSHAVIEQLCDKRVFPQLRDVTFALMHSEIHEGFDHVGALLRLVEARGDQLRRIEGAFTGSHDRIFYVWEEMNKSGIIYDLWIHGDAEGFGIYLLQKGERPIHGVLQDDGSVMHIGHV